MNIEKRVKELVEEKISDRSDLFLVEATMHSNGRLIVLIDGDHGVDIKDCVAVSRHVGFHLEEENVIDEAYTLEVSSPGIDAPLRNLRQYTKNLNRNLSVKSSDQKTYEGKLIATNDTGLTLLINNQTKGKKTEPIETVIPFEQIVEAKVLVSFK